jgi:hypothetical protein
MKEKVGVPRKLLKGAFDAGMKLYHEYPEALSGNAENNRAMELAFLWGLLGYRFDSAGIEAEALK